MGKDRQRAKQRRAQREAQRAMPAQNQPIRENVPGELDHSSGEVDEFEAKLVSEADGVAAPATSIDGVAGEEHPEDLSDADFAALEDEVEDVEEAIESGDQSAIAAAEADAERSVERRGKAKPSPDTPTKKGGFRFVAFLRASWAELQRVQWPDRRQVGQATAVVLGFVVVAGLYLGVADAAANWLVDRIV